MPSEGRSVLRRVERVVAVAVAVAVGGVAVGGGRSAGVADADD